MGVVYRLDAARPRAHFRLPVREAFDPSSQTDRGVLRANPDLLGCWDRRLCCDASLPDRHEANDSLSLQFGGWASGPGLKGAD